MFRLPDLDDLFLHLADSRAVASATEAETLPFVRALDYNVSIAARARRESDAYHAARAKR